MQFLELRVQNIASSVQIPASRVQRPGSRAKSPACRVQNPESRIQSPASSVHCSKSRVQRPESRVQYPGSWVLSPESGVKSPASRVQSPESTVLGQPPRVQGQTLASTVQKFRYAYIHVIAAINFNSIWNNVKGLKLTTKRIKLFEYFKSNLARSCVLFAQEIHSTMEIEQKWKDELNAHIYFLHGEPNLCGVFTVFLEVNQ